ncbi:MAG: adenylosuccinate lyase [Phycisphaeraceae bacterium]|nr:adenylosuccinate lyase [Phycisphaeraceae bacterium]
MPGPYDTYTSPLATRNASPEMLRLWSARHKFNTWRRIWLAVAEAMHEVGQRAASVSERTTGADQPLPHGRGSSGPLVTQEQVDELRAVVERGITDEEIRKAEEYERELRHDVMAHVHALGDSCPKARPIIHLGMTSQDVVCNADLVLVQQALDLVHHKIGVAICVLGSAADRWSTIPTLGFTHYQPAQPTTVGRRLANWAADLSIRGERVLDGCIYHSMYRGLRGATGTQASFLALFEGDSAKVDELEWRFLWRMQRLQNEEIARIDDEDEEFHNYHPRSREVCPLDREELERLFADRAFALTGQTYPRVVDAEVLAGLASTAAVLHKIATDIRLLSNRKELDEPFESKQIGSSAMPYKRNPMRCERICGLTRFVMNLVGNAYDTAATQWLERTLDDSSNRRLSLPEAFLALDGALDLMHNVASGLIVHEAMVRRNLMAELPFLATENILMACVRLGGDRQDYHERIRVHAQAAGMRVKQQGLDNDLLDRLRADPAFQPKARGGMLDGEIDWDGLMDPMKYIGRSVEQTERFIREVVEPLREQYGESIEKLGESGPRV